MASKLVAELVLEVGKMQAGLRKAQSSLRSASKNMGQSSGKGVAGGIGKGIATNGLLIAAGLATALVAAAAVAVYRAGKVITQGIKEAAENERFQMRFEVLTGSRGAGNRALKELRADAMRTGVSLENMADNVGKFIAFGFDNDDALDLQRGILDVGGAVGLTNREMKLLGVALSQIAAKGTAQMEELRQQVAEKGIPIFKALEQQLGVTGAELSKMIQEGKVGAGVVMDIFKGAAKGEGPFARFAGGADKMAQTFLGRIGVIKTHWHEFLRIFGAPIRESLLPLLEVVLRHVQGMLPLAEEWGKKVANVVTYLTAAAKTIQEMYTSAGEGLRATFQKAVAVIQNLLYKALAGAISAAVTFMMESFQRVFAVVSTFFSKDMDTMMKRSFKTGVAMLEGSLYRAAIGFLKKIREGLGAAGRFMLDGKIAKFEAELGERDQSIRDAQGTQSGEVGRITDRLTEAYMDSVKSSAAAFVKGYNETPNVYGEGAEGGLQNFTTEVRKTYEALRKQRNAALAAKDTLVGKAIGGASSAGGGAGGGKGGIATNSLMAQAVNTISGRSAFAVMATEGQKTNAKLDRTNQLLESVISNTKRRNQVRRPGAGQVNGGDEWLRGDIVLASM